MKSKKDVLPSIRQIIEHKCGPLTSISGQGIMKGERNKFVLNGKQVTGIIKTSTNGRVSFAKHDDGKWVGLAESDFVFIAGPITESDPTPMVSMFDRKIMLDAFNANQAAQEKDGKGHLPNWIAPFHEEGRGSRGVGDGFQEKALWTEPLDPKSGSAALAAKSPPQVPSSGLTIDQAKAGLAKTFGVPPESIEITIRG